MLFNDTPKIGRRPTPPEQRFWPKVNKNGPLFNGIPCWLWTAHCMVFGYGVFWVHGPYAAHRFAYELHYGTIPQGLTIDHLCRVRHCVNPAHLEAVTRGENVLRGVGFSATNARVTHCPQGHPYDEANTRIERTKTGTMRRCKICRRIYYRKWRHSVKLQRALT